MEDELVFWATQATKHERDATFWRNLAIEYASDVEELEHRYDALLAAQAAEDELRDSAIFGEQQANRTLRAQIAVLQAELALQDNIDPEIDAEVQRQFKALWDSCEEPKYATPRMYKYFVPSCVYPPRRCRRRTFKYYNRLHRHRWLGGIVNKELMALAVHESLYATPRELARLRAYADDWDAMAEQMLNDSIPW